MKEWQVTIGGALVMFVAALGMFLWTNSIELPKLLEYYLTTVPIYNQYFMAYLAGVLFTGFGGAFLICTILVYQLEKKLESKPPDTQTATQEKS